MGPLSGQRIVVTRPAHQAEELAAPLRQLGAEVILLPTIGIAAPVDPAPLRLAASQCDAYDWIVFTSVNAIEAFVAELPPGKVSYRARIATVGTATREAAERRGFRVSVTPKKYVSESLVEAFRAEEMTKLRVLIPSAAVTRDVVATELRKCGAEVTVVEAYRNVMPAEAAKQVAAVFRDPYPDWITFTSSSSVDNLVQISGVEPLQPVKIATIGPVTSETARRHGLRVTSEARMHTVAGLISAICGFQM